MSFLLFLNKLKTRLNNTPYYRKDYRKRLKSLINIYTIKALKGGEI